MSVKLDTFRPSSTIHVLLGHSCVVEWQNLDYDCFLILNKERGLREVIIVHISPCSGESLKFFPGGFVPLDSPPLCLSFVSSLFFHIPTFPFTPPPPQPP